MLPPAGLRAALQAHTSAVLQLAPPVAIMMKPWSRLAMLCMFLMGIMLLSAPAFVAAQDEVRAATCERGRGARANPRRARPTESGAGG